MPEIKCMDPKNVKFHLLELKDVYAELSDAIAALFTVWEAMEHGAAEKNIYRDALHSVYDTISLDSDYMQDHISALLSEMGCGHE